MSWVARLLLILAFAPCMASAAGDYRLAVYYYPGWKDNAPGAKSSHPWDLIKPYPEREPLLGWYSEGAVQVMDQHLKWMKDYGIKDVVFDWYWDGDTSKPILSHALDAYLVASSNSDIGFGILWANHRTFPYSMMQFDRMVDYWIANILPNQRYMRDNGIPVVMIFSADILEKSANNIGLTTKDLLSRANQLAIASGLPGIKFVVNSNAAWGTLGPEQRGYAAMTGYVYRQAFSGKVEPYPKNYSQMTSGYKTMWSWIINHMTTEYWPPVAFGWDMRPWGAVEEQDYCCASRLSVFEAHLRDAKALVDAHSARTRNTILICCWNEFGEGNYIEPTKRDGFAYLEAVRRVFVTGK